MKSRAKLLAMSKGERERYVSGTCSFIFESMWERYCRKNNIDEKNLSELARSLMRNIFGFYLISLMVGFMAERLNESDA